MNGATLSDCGKFRYRLEREIPDASGPIYAFFGINPSTADATVDDQTVGKWIGFVSRWGGRRFIVGNVFAYRATDVRELAGVMHPTGLDNAEHLKQIAADADILVPCWGNRSKVHAGLRYHFDNTLVLLRRTGKPMKCFGRTKSRDPLHPLMLGYDTKLEDL
jgi:hypothetical protein